MFIQRIIPVVTGPWIGFSLLSVFSVVIYSRVGKIVAGRPGMIIIGLVSAVASAPVLISSDMLNTAIVGFSSSLVFLATAKYLKENNKFTWASTTGFFVGLSVTFHFQAVGLFAIPLLIVLVNKDPFIKRVKTALSFGLGIIVSFLPLIIFDIARNGIWIKSVYQYYTVGVKKFYVPLRWLTELRDFWPQQFGNVISGIDRLGYVWLMLGIIAIFWVWRKKKKQNLFWLIIGLSFVIQIILMRYYKGPRSKEYLVASHGYIILIVSWILINFYKINKAVGIGLTASLIIISSISNYQFIKNHSSQAKDILLIKKELDAQINDNVSIYNFHDSNMITFPMFYLYYHQSRVEDSGTPLGFCDKKHFSCPENHLIENERYRTYLLNDKNISVFEKVSDKEIFEILMVNYKDN